MRWARLVSCPITCDSRLQLLPPTIVTLVTCFWVWAAVGSFGGDRLLRRARCPFRQRACRNRISRCFHHKPWPLFFQAGSKLLFAGIVRLRINQNLRRNRTVRAITVRFKCWFHNTIVSALAGDTQASLCSGASTMLTSPYPGFAFGQLLRWR